MSGITCPYSNRIEINKFVLPILAECTDHTDSHLLTIVSCHLSTLSEKQGAVINTILHTQSLL